ncbi:hypothetical protein LUX57_41980 [Actinomadura madurae]|nr:hypothetical protein [Actinomadura madurae]MCP9970924.1 hypothetical protein [Actinomadura madurae]
MCSGARPASSRRARTRGIRSAAARRPTIHPYQPSAWRAARRSAAGLWPPVTTGIGRWTGRGYASTPSNRTWRPWKAGLSSYQSDRMAARYSSARAPRPSGETPTARISGSRYPAAAPKISRPSLSTSTLASCFARTSGFRCGRTTTPVPSAIRSVRAARCARATSGSVNGASGSAGDGSTRGLGRTTWSPTHMES